MTPATYAFQAVVEALRIRARPSAHRQHGVRHACGASNSPRPSVRRSRIPQGGSASSGIPPATPVAPDMTAFATQLGGSSTFVAIRRRQPARPTSRAWYASFDRSSSAYFAVRLSRAAPWPLHRRAGSSRIRGARLTPHCSGLGVSRCAPSFSPLNSISLGGPRWTSAAFAMLASITLCLELAGPALAGILAAAASQSLFARACGSFSTASSFTEACRATFAYVSVGRARLPDGWSFIRHPVATCRRCSVHAPVWLVSHRDGRTGLRRHRSTRSRLAAWSRTSEAAAQRFLLVQSRSWRHRMVLRGQRAPPNNALQRTRRQSLRSFLLAAELDIVRWRRRQHENSSRSGPLRRALLSRVW